MAHLRVNYMGDLIALRSRNVDLQLSQEGALIATLHVRPVLRQRIQEAQSADPQLNKISEKIGQGVDTLFSIQDGTLMY